MLLIFFGSILFDHGLPVTDYQMSLNMSTYTRVDCDMVGKWALNLACLATDRMLYLTR